MYVGNRISHIVELIAPDHWGHVAGVGNPADCASRSLLPSELLAHNLRGDGPTWLQLSPNAWPKQPHLLSNASSEEGDEVCVHAAVVHGTPIIPLDRFSSFTRLLRVTVWIIRFTHNFRAHKKGLV